MSGLRYLAYALGYTLCIVAIIVPVNFVVDPFGIYLYGTKWDWPHSRPAILDQTYLHKARQLERANADVLILGSSRVAWGIDPHSPELPPHAYNAALAGSRAYENLRYLQHAGAAHMPKIVILGIDSSFFVPSSVNIQFTEDRMKVGIDGTVKPAYAYAYAFADVIPTLLSLSTFKLSLQSAFTRCTQGYDFDDGFSPPKAFFWDGWHTVESVLKTNAKIDREWLDEGDPFRKADGTAPQMDAFDQMISFCARNHIRFILFINPTHAVTLDRLTRNWGNYCDWMRAIAARTNLHPGAEVELWDFSGYDFMSTERFPQPGDKHNNMVYYYDRIHYRSNVGEMVLQRVFTGKGPRGFGQRVTMDTVGQDLQRLKAEKEAWHAQGEPVKKESAFPDSSTK